MKFYYPEWDKVSKVITTVNGEPISAYNAQTVTPSLMYLRVNMGEYVRFVDYLGNKVGKDYIAATVHNAAGFARANVSTNMQIKEIYLDIFLRESETVTLSGVDAYGLFAELYSQESFRPVHGWIAGKVKEMSFEYFEDDAFYQGMIKMLVKYLRDEAQYAYENHLEQDSVQTIQETLQRFKEICQEKREKALEEKRAREEKINRRENIFKAAEEFLDSYQIDGQTEGERAMVCVNEEDADEYDI